MPRFVKILLPVLIILGVFAALLSLGIYSRFIKTKEPERLSKPVTLSWWRVFDSEDDVKDIITAYEKLHPNITIEYRRLRLEEYEQKLLEAMA